MFYLQLLNDRIFPKYCVCFFFIKVTKISRKKVTFREKKVKLSRKTVKGHSKTNVHFMSLLSFEAKNKTVLSFKANCLFPTFN